MGWNLDSRFTIGHGVLVKPVKTVRDLISGHVIVSLGKRATTCKNFNTFWRLLGEHRCWVHLARVAHVSHLTTHTHLTRHLTFLPARLHAEQTHVTTRWYRAVTSVIQRAASSYNNIALWRSPERTGKCRLCARTGRGGAGLRGCLYSPNNSVRWAGRGRLRKAGRGGRGGGGVQRGHLQVSPLGLTRCESLPEGG